MKTFIQHEFWRYLPFAQWLSNGIFVDSIVSNHWSKPPNHHASLSRTSLFCSARPLRTWTSLNLYNFANQIIRRRVAKKMLPHSKKIMILPKPFNRIRDPIGFPRAAVNAVCRAENPAMTSKIQYYLGNLQQHLTRLYEESLVWIPSFITVYRGQRLSSDDFDKLARSKGKLIVTTHFLSATHSSDIAALFSGDERGVNTSPSHKVSVIFKITIRTSTAHSSPLAYIQQFSRVDSEKDTLHWNIVEMHRNRRTWGKSW